MKILFLFLLVLCSQVFGYVDMNLTLNRANDLNMTQADYTNAMALAGMLSSGLLGLFLWKTL